jgi:hypothetical protein
MEIEPSLLVIHVMIVSLATLGIVEWLKNWVCPKRTQMYSLLGLFVLAINVTMQMPFIHPVVTTFWNLFTLGTAIMQFGHTALVKVPNAVINKTLGG